MNPGVETLIEAVGESELSVARRLEDQLNEVLLGKQWEIRIFLSAVLSGGHVLLVDAPGVGKTTLARAYAASIDTSFSRVQGTMDLLPADLTGVSIYEPQHGGWTFHPGPLTNSVVLVDEVDRIPPRTQSALLEALAENQVTVDGVTHPVPLPFSVVATSNASGDAGGFPMIAGLLDRFAVSMSLGLPDREHERRVVRGDVAADRAVLPVIDGAGISRLRELVSAVHISDDVVDYCLGLVDGLRDGNWLSSRAGQALVRTSKGLALLEGRDHVIPDDVREVAPQVLGHRLGARRPADLDRETVRDALAAQQVPVPGR